MNAMMIELRKRLMLTKRPSFSTEPKQNRGNHSNISYSPLRWREIDSGDSDDEESESESIPRLLRAEDFLQNTQPSIHKGSYRKMITFDPIITQ